MTYQHVRNSTALAGCLLVSLVLGGCGAGTNAHPQPHAQSPAGVSTAGQPTDLSYALGDDYCAKALALNDFSSLTTNKVELTAGTSGSFSDGVGCSWTAHNSTDSSPDLTVELDKFTVAEAASNSPATGNGWIGALYSDKYTSTPLPGFGPQDVLLMPKANRLDYREETVAFLMGDTVIGLSAEIDAVVDQQSGDKKQRLTAAALATDLTALAQKVRTNLTGYASPQK